ncbi:hypothetical protein IAT38_006153 [Cryptococcus sp. DSM 104549]
MTALPPTSSAAASASNPNPVAPSTPTIPTNPHQTRRASSSSRMPRTPRIPADTSSRPKPPSSSESARRSKPTFTSSLHFPEVLPQPTLFREDVDLQRSQRRSKVEALTKLDRAGTPVQIAASAAPAATSFLPTSAQPKPDALPAGPSPLKNPLNKPVLVNPAFSIDSVRTTAPRHPPPRTTPRLFGLEECPSFYPTPEEFKDPMAYIDSIAEQGKPYGICKIVPPEGWNMPFALQPDSFRFKSRLQRLNQLEAASRAKVNFLEQLSMFHMQQGDAQVSIPLIDRQPLDVWKLRREVNKAGGYLELDRTHGWPGITEQLGHKPAWSPHVRAAYMSIILPFDNWAVRAKSSSVSPLAHLTPNGAAHASPARPPGFVGEPNVSPSKSARATRMGLTSIRITPKTRMAAAAAAAAASGSGGASTRSPSKRVAGLPPGGLATAAEIGKAGTTVPGAVAGAVVGANPGAVAETSAAAAAAASAPAASSATSSTFPSLKILVPGFNKEDGSESDLSDEESALTALSTPGSAGKDGAGEPAEYQKGEICEICRGEHNGDKILLCDGCDRGFHTYCLDPPLSAVPSNEEWFCTSCLLSQGDDFGFEEGDEHSIHSFQARDAAFSYAWWNRHRFAAQGGSGSPSKAGASVPPPSMGHGTPKQENGRMNGTGERPLSRQFGKVTVTEDDVEREFWRLTESATDTVDVEYGADIHSTTHGSAGPTMETHPTDPYAADPWNLNNMPILPDSLLRYIKSDISGMTVPWIYIGMMFSTFCWHNEDHYTYSVNYMYWGETKTWYGVPGGDADKFEAAIKSEAPDLFEQQPGLLFQLVTMMNPGRLSEAGVKVVACDQRPNEFVVTFPKAYHCGFNHGINMNEAVNFALPDWLKEGKESVGRYKEHLKAPVFSHNELLITITLYSETIKTALWLKDALVEMVAGELSQRDALRASHPALNETLVEEDSPEEQYQCAICKSFCYLAQVTCTCTKLVACLSHADQLCGCARPKRTLRKRYSEAQLEEIRDVVVARAGLPEQWRARYRALMENPRPSLKSMRALAGEGERIAYPLRENKALKKFVERGTALMEKITAISTRKNTARRRKPGRGEEDAVVPATGWRRGRKERERAEKEKEEEEEEVDRSPQLLVDLLKQADRMAFDSPELPQLRQLMTTIEGFRADAQAILDTPEDQLDRAKCKTALILGQSLNLDLPELPELKRIVQRQSWFKKLEEEVDDRSLQYEDVVALLEEAVACDIPADHQIVQELQRRREKGKQWLDACEALLAAPKIQIDEITALIEPGELIPFSTDMLRELEAIRKMVLSWQASAKNHLLTNGSSVAAARLCKNVEAARDPINKVVIPEVIQLQAELDHHALWSREAAEMLGVPVPRLVNTIDYIRREFENNLAEVDDEPNTDRVCFCRSPATASMVKCKTCEGEYHPRCVDVAPRNVGDPFQCAMCARLPNDDGPSLDAFLQLISPERWNFVVTPNEFAAAQKITDAALRYAPKLIRVADPLSQAEPELDVARIRHVIRKVYTLPLVFDTINYETGQRCVVVNWLFRRMQDAIRARAGQQVKASTAAGGPNGPAWAMTGEGGTPSGRAKPRRKAKLTIEQSKPGEFHCVCSEPTVRGEGKEIVTCPKCEQQYHADCIHASSAFVAYPWRCPCCAVKDGKHYQRGVELRVQMKDDAGTDKYIDYRATINGFVVNPVILHLQPWGSAVNLTCSNFHPAYIPEEVKMVSEGGGVGKKTKKRRITDVDGVADSPNGSPAVRHEQLNGNAAASSRGSSPVAKVAAAPSPVVAAPTPAPAPAAPAPAPAAAPITARIPWRGTPATTSNVQRTIYASSRGNGTNGNASPADKSHPFAPTLTSSGSRAVAGASSLGSSASSASARAPAPAPVPSTQTQTQKQTTPKVTIRLGNGGGLPYVGKAPVPAPEATTAPAVPAAAPVAAPAVEKPQSQTNGVAAEVKQVDTEVPSKASETPSGAPDEAPVPPVATNGDGEVSKEGVSAGEGNAL